MFRSMVFHSILAAAFGVAMALPCVAQSQESDSSQDKHLDIQSSSGDLHVGNDADARKAGLPLILGHASGTMRKRTATP